MLVTIWTTFLFIAQNLTSADVYTARLYRYLTSGNSDLATYGPPLDPNGAGTTTTAQVTWNNQSPRAVGGASVDGLGTEALSKRDEEDTPDDEEDHDLDEDDGDSDGDDDDEVTDGDGVARRTVDDRRARFMDKKRKKSKFGKTKVRYTHRKPKKPKKGARSVNGHAESPPPSTSTDPGTQTGPEAVPVPGPSGDPAPSESSNPTRRATPPTEVDNSEEEEVDEDEDDDGDEGDGVGRRAVDLDDLPFKSKKGRLRKYKHKVTTVHNRPLPGLAEVPPPSTADLDAGNPPRKRGISPPDQDEIDGDEDEDDDGDEGGAVGRRAVDIDDLPFKSRKGKLRKWKVTKVNNSPLPPSTLMDPEVGTNPPRKRGAPSALDEEVDGDDDDDDEGAAEGDGVGRRAIGLDDLPFKSRKGRLRKYKHKVISVHNRPLPGPGEMPPPSTSTDADPDAGNPPTKRGVAPLDEEEVDGDEDDEDDDDDDDQGGGVGRRAIDIDDLPFKSRKGRVRKWKVTKVNNSPLPPSRLTDFEVDTNPPRKRGTPALDEEETDGDEDDDQLDSADGEGVARRTTDIDDLGRFKSRKGKLRKGKFRKPKKFNKSVRPVQAETPPPSTSTDQGNANDGDGNDGGVSRRAIDVGNLPFKSRKGKFRKPRPVVVEGDGQGDPPPPSETVTVPWVSGPGEGTNGPPAGDNPDPLVENPPPPAPTRTRGGNRGGGGGGIVPPGLGGNRF